LYSKKKKKFQASQIIKHNNLGGGGNVVWKVEVQEKRGGLLRS